MAKERVFQVYNDPGHAWAKVPRKTLKDLGIEDKITSYSYQRGDYAYLEEDCDLSTLISALKARGIQPVFREYHGNKISRIRNYESYKASAQ